MSSIIPKISVGLGSGKREKHNLSFDNSTTANIGTVQPTMCREMAPNTSYKVKVSSLVRLASMPTPTFGRMSLRHYHRFIPLEDIWQPFNAMISGQHYHDDSDAWIPTKVPVFRLPQLYRRIVHYSDICIAPGTDVSNPYTITTTNVDWEGNVYTFGEGGTYADEAAAIAAAQAADVARIATAYNAIKNRNSFDGAVTSTMWFDSDEAGSTAPEDRGVLNCGDCWVQMKAGSTPTLGTNIYPYAAGNTTITPEGADLITYVNGYYVLLKFKAPVKRLRTIFIGLGYPFSLYDEEEHSALKLFAYYKAWFDTFSPIRERAFVDTSCYKVLKACGANNGQNIFSITESTEFMNDLMFDAYYYLPMDYFSMAVTRPGNNSEDNDVVLTTGYNTNLQGTGTVAEQATVQSQGEYTPGSGIPVITGSNLTPTSARLANMLLTWSSKNTVIGRSIRDYLKVHFGITEVAGIDAGGVTHIGQSRVNIYVSDVMSTAESEQGYLGEYAGRGIGKGESETFDFTAKKFGYWITLTAIVPESGYYQGYLRENRHLTRFDFFNPEFDAKGYQVLERGELMDDYNCDGPEFKPTSDFARTYAFGFVPRYSEYKTGRNVVNGDISLAGLYHSMAPYTLDRRISAGAIRPTDLDLVTGKVRKVITAPSFIPTVVHDAFRRIDPSDHLGQYNRIFNYGGNDLDHFIIHNVFDVVAYAPMKSLSESFDTLLGDDDKTTDITHS